MDPKIVELLTHLASPVIEKAAAAILQTKEGDAHQYVVRDPKGGLLSILNFQKGPIGEVGVNGITNEIALAVVLNRLEAFQKGPYACLENAEAISHVQAALNVLHARTLKRIQQGVEGLNKTHDPAEPAPKEVPAEDQKASA